MAEISAASTHGFLMLALAAAAAVVLVYPLLRSLIAIFGITLPA